MAILEIIKYPDRILKKCAQPIERIEPPVHQLVQDMSETMYAAPGVGLAAPQVGHSLRLIVIDTNRADQPKNRIVLINPEIVLAEGECVWEEGCLSVPDCSEEVKRMKKVVVRGLGLTGEILEVVGEDLLSVVLQHEIDHLNGILFIDRLSPLKRELFKRKLQKENREGKKA